MVSNERKSERGRATPDQNMDHTNESALVEFDSSLFSRKHSQHGHSLTTEFVSFTDRNGVDSFDGCNRLNHRWQALHKSSKAIHCRFLHRRQRNTGRTRIPMINTVGMAMTRRTISPASAMGLRRRAPKAMEPRTSQRSTG